MKTWRQKITLFQYLVIVAGGCCFVHGQLADDLLPRIRATREGLKAIPVAKPDPSLNGKVVVASGPLEVEQSAKDPDLGVSWPGLIWLSRTPNEMSGQGWQLAQGPHPQATWTGQVTLRGCKVAPATLRQFKRTLTPRMDPPQGWRRSGYNGIFLQGTASDPKAQAYRLIYRSCAAKTVTIVARYQNGALEPWFPTIFGNTITLVAAGEVPAARVVADHGAGYRSLLGPRVVIPGLLVLMISFLILKLNCGLTWLQAQTFTLLAAMVLCVTILGTLLVP